MGQPAAAIVSTGRRPARPAATALSEAAVWGRPVEREPHRSVRRSLFFRRTFDWKDDMPPLTPLEDSIIYELHVRGFTATRRPASRIPAPSPGWPRRSHT